MYVCIFIIFYIYKQEEDKTRRKMKKNLEPKEKKNGSKKPKCVTSSLLYSCIFVLPKSLGKGTSATRCSHRISEMASCSQEV